MPCAICDDTGWQAIEIDGVTRVVRCDCWTRATIERVARDAGIPPRYEKCDLDNFHDYNDSLSKAVGRARRFVEEFPGVSRGLLFVGRPGLGKTHLAIACLKLAATARGLRGVFHDTRELLRRIRQSYDPVTRVVESERDVVNAVVGADLLVLDDIGAERATEWVEEMLHLIVNARYNERRPMIFTTNYPIEAPPDAKHAETLLERVGFRMYSRLQEMCDFVHLEGVDYRELGPNPTVEALARLSDRGSRTHKNLPGPNPRSQIKARFRGSEPAPDLKWPGGKAGS